MSFQNGAPPTSRKDEAPTMMFDDDSSSRDSGICDMEEGAPTCFSELTVVEKAVTTTMPPSSISTVTYTVMECEEREVVEKKAVNSAKKAPKMVEFRRKSSVRRLFKSPSSSNLASPGLIVRPANMQQQRKRSYEAANGVVSAAASSSAVPVARVASEIYPIPLDSPRIPSNGKKRRMRESGRRSSDHPLLNLESHLEAMEVTVDEDPTELMELCDTVDQQSTSAAPSPFQFVAPAPGPLVHVHRAQPPRPTHSTQPTQPAQPIPRFLSHSSFFNQRPADKEEEVVDDKPYEEKYGEAHLVVDYQLETIASDCSTSFRRISAETLCREMQNDDFTEKYMLVDCRYPYEYEKGHIKHAINYYDRDNVSNLFFNTLGETKHSRVPIFYCEFSQKRGPSMATALRADDRKKNVHMYPRCRFEEMYVLDKGYKNFYESLTEAERVSQFCVPTDYVRMEDKAYARELKKYNFHRRGTVGQSIMRAESCDAIGQSSSKPAAPNPSARCDEKENRTPANPRAPSLARRQLNFDVFNSPTNFHRDVPVSNAPQTPSPSKNRKPLRLPQFT